MTVASRTSTGPAYWALIPAAGIGKRMGSDTPKQYLALLGRPVIAHSIERLGNHPRMAGIIVVLRSGDPFWPHVELQCRVPVWTAIGGVQRCDSVLHGLRELSEHAASDDWVLVHDAARPCLRDREVDRLIEELGDDPVGGLLAVPVSDTLKRADHRQRVLETVQRRGLWCAQTPQMFRMGALLPALQEAIQRGGEVTDEAAAMEYAGAQPRLVVGDLRNIKVTHPEDLSLAALYLRGDAGVK